MKSKILFIMHMPPPIHGAAMVGKYIHDSKVINESFDCHYFNLTLARDLSDIGKGGVRKLTDFIRQLFRIRKEVKRIKPDVCYVTPNAKGGAFYKDYVVVQMLKRLGCRIVIHYHNKGVATRQEKALDNFLYKRFFKGLKVILLAESLYDDVKKYVARKDIFICPNGIPETLHEEPTAQRHNKIPHLLFLSNLLVSKGVLVLLDACRILKERGYSFVCDFVGGETYEMSAKQFDEEVMKRDLNQVAVYQGRKYGVEKSDALSKADVFVFPTFYHNETFGLVNLEAMEHKLPVVTTDEGGIKDVVRDGENGLIAEKNNPMSLADCIGELLDDEKLRHKMGEDGYQKFLNRYTIGKFETNLHKMLTDVTRGGKCSFVFYWGKKYGEDKMKVLHKADIFVFPTYYSNECFPIVLLEAMRQGLPCISTAEGGIREIIDDGRSGYIIEQKSAISLADKIAYLIERPKLRKEMGENGYKKYCSQFSLQIFENQMKNILQNIVDKNK